MKNNTSPYREVIFDILRRHGYTKEQLEDAEYHANIHQPIEWSKMVHVIIEFVRYIEQHKGENNE